jgi:hypothetical protein
MSRIAALAVAALLAAACASTPKPSGDVDKADLALRKAEAVNAAEVAPLDARIAREKLEKAKLQMSSDNYAAAKRLAEEAEVDALVAEAKARSTRLDEQVKALQAEVDALHRGAAPTTTRTEIIVK